MNSSEKKHLVSLSGAQTELWQGYIALSSYKYVVQSGISNAMNDAFCLNPSSFSNISAKSILNCIHFRGVC